MTKFFFQIYHLIWLAFLSYNARFFVNQNHFNIELTMFAKPFSYLANPEVLFPLVFLLTVSLTLFNLIRHNLIVFSLTTVCYLLLFSLKHSFGKIDHNMQGWMVLSVLFCGLNIKQPLSSFRNLTIIRLGQCLLLSHYFSSGLWKVRKMFNSPPDSIYNLGLEHFATTIAGGSGTSLLIENFFVENDWLLGLGFIIVLIFQLTALIPFFLNKWYKAWAFVAVGFHIVTGFSLAIWFKPTIISLIFLLYITEELMTHESNNVS